MCLSVVTFFLVLIKLRRELFNLHDQLICEIFHLYGFTQEFFPIDHLVILQFFADTLSFEVLIDSEFTAEKFFGFIRVLIVFRFGWKVHLEL